MPPPFPFGQAGKWQLIFSDDFDGNALNTNVWEPSWFGGVGLSVPVNPAEEACYNPAQLTVSDGTLKITVAANSDPACQKRDLTQAPYKAGLINTRNSFLMTHGYFEARVKLPGTGGLIDNWGAFWSTGTGVWPVTGEIDVMESLEDHKPYWFYHYDDGGPQSQGAAVDMDGTGWHVYAVKREPRKLTWYYDGVQVAQIVGSIVIDAEHFLIADYTVSTAIAGTPVVPATMEVDYIRVWKEHAARRRGAKRYMRRKRESSFGGGASIVPASGTTLNALSPSLPPPPPPPPPMPRTMGELMSMRSSDVARLAQAQRAGRE